MNGSDKRWIVRDRYGNPIYLTHERWIHIIADTNHPEMIDYEEHLKTTIQAGRRRQEPLNPSKYRYFHRFDMLPDDVNHIISVVMFGFNIDDRGHTLPNNFVTTAFFKHIRI